MSEYEACLLCPHRCGVDRTRGERGVCGQSDVMNIAWIGLHKGEEPPISGEHGSGTIFFTGCTLQCPSCQNHQISCRGTSFNVPVTVEELITYMLELQEMGAASINLITGTHFIPSIRTAILGAKAQGLSLPVVWNSSGFELPEALELIDEWIDLYLVDIKTLDAPVAQKFCGCSGYADGIDKLTEYLVKKHPVTQYDEKGRLSGTLVRHLVYPGEMESSHKVLRYYEKKLKAHAHLSLMVQFSDPFDSGKYEKITEKEYESLLDLLEGLSIEEGFVQELEDNVDWIPDFTRINPFPEGFAVPLSSFIEKRGINR